MALSAALSGCGQGSSAARADCGEVMNEAAANVVRAAYNDGKLGTRAQVQRVLGGPQYFTSDGHLKPYASLNVEQKGEFDHWMRQNPRVLRVTLKERLAAEKRATARAKQMC